jgi:hypothetical protein
MGDATQGPMDSLHFFFSFELSYQGEPRSPSGRGLGVFDGQFSQNSCRACLHCAEWSCVVLSDSRRHRGIGQKLAGYVGDSYKGRHLPGLRVAGAGLRPLPISDDNTLVCGWPCTKLTFRVAPTLELIPFGHGVTPG